MKNIWILSILTLLFSGVTFSQNSSDEEPKYAVTKTDGTVYIGTILSDDGREILMMTDNLGKIYIPKSDIKSIKKVEESDIKLGVYVGENIFTTRYQFTTNAFPIKKHENYTVLNLYGPEVHYSVADNLSVGIMATWIASPIALALKYTFPTDNTKLNFGVGTLLGSSGYLNRARGYGGLHWAMVTYGDRYNNITASAGYAYFNSGDGSPDLLYPTGTYEQIPDPYGLSFNLPQAIGYGRGTYSAPTFGLSGMFAVGEKATFIIDIMAVFATQNRSYQNIYYNGSELWNSTQISFSEPIAYKSTSTNYVVMPAMRFQRKIDRAFQVSLAGVIGKQFYRENNFYSNQFGNKVESKYSFPFPMLSWFFKF